MTKFLTGLLLIIVLTTLCVALPASAQVAQERIPRQSAPATAIAGIVTTQAGLGLGGVAVVLQNVASGKTYTATTTGDGAFRFLKLEPGRYQVNATRDGFQPFCAGRDQLAAGDVFPLMFMMASPTGNDGAREIPRQPGLGPQPAPPQEPATSSTYRNLPSEPPPGDTGEAKPLSPIPTDDQVFASGSQSLGLTSFPRIIIATRTSKCPT